MIRFKKLPIDEKEIKAVTKILKAGWLGPGKTTFEFEQCLTRFAGAKYCIAVNSGTSAIYLSLAAKIHFRELDRSQAVTIPSMMAPEVANIILQAGLKLVWQDDPDWVGGFYRLKPTGIIDSAHEVSPNQYSMIKGSDNDLLCYSFYPTKSIASADGGAILTNNQKYAVWLRKASFSGRRVDALGKSSWEYEIDFPGWKANFTDVQAAIALTQLKKFNRLYEIRTKIRDYYNKSFDLANTSLYLYRMNVPERNRFIEYMKRNGVECGIHFRPLHLQKAYINLDPKPLPKTEACWTTTVSLPFHTFLTKNQLKKIVELTFKWLKQHNHLLATAITESPNGKLKKRIKKLSKARGAKSNLFNIGSTG